MLLYNLHNLLLGFSRSQSDTFWDCFLKTVTQVSYLFSYVWLFPLVALSVTFSYQNHFRAIDVTISPEWLIHWSRFSVRSVFLLNVLYLKLWPWPFWWQIQLITICTKCFPPAKSSVSELYWLFVMGEKSTSWWL